MRTINTTPPEFEDSLLCEKGITTDTYTIKIVTPMFGGGTRPGQIDEDMPIRASSIRGHLRYWWRMLYGKGNSSEMFKEESELWGCAACDDGQKNTTSIAPAAVLTVAVGKITFNGIIQMRNSAGKFKMNYRKKDFNFNFEKYGPEMYALFSARENNEKLLDCGYEFDLLVSYYSDIDVTRKKQISNSIKLWCLLGGIGSRTRRGCGSLSLEKINNINNVINKEDIIEYFDIYVKEVENPLKGWKISLDTYMCFRQMHRGKKHCKKIKDKNVNVPGRSYWPEPDSIREITNCSLKTQEANGDPAIDTHNHATPIVPVNVLNTFPRAAMGLPLIFHFADGGKKHPRTSYSLLLIKLSMIEIPRRQRFSLLGLLRIKMEKKKSGKNCLATQVP